MEMSLDRLARGRDARSRRPGWHMCFKSVIAAHGAGHQRGVRGGADGAVAAVPAHCRWPRRRCCCASGATSRRAPATTSTPPASGRLSELVRESSGHEFVFVTDYPSAVRPFYHMRHPEDPGLTRSFDLLWRGIEITTGAQREHRYEQLLAQAREKGVETGPIEYYLDFFRYGAPPHGGLRVRAVPPADADAGPGERARGRPSCIADRTGSRRRRPAPRGAGV